MYTAFLSVLVACGAPPLVSALVTLGIFSNVMGCTTHYGIGSAPPFFGAGYVPLPTWWKIGFGYVRLLHRHLPRRRLCPVVEGPRPLLVGQTLSRYQAQLREQLVLDNNHMYVVKRARVPLQYRANIRVR